MRQTERILEYLKTHKGITDSEARRDLGIARLGARIWDLKAMGYITSDIWETAHNRFGDPTRFKRYFVQEKDDEEHLAV